MTTEKTKSTATTADISTLVRLYVRTAERYHDAEKWFKEACADLRGELTPGDKFYIEIDYQTHLVEVDKDGDFAVTPIRRVY